MSWQDFKKQLSDFLEVPGDVALDLPKITLVGNIRVFIENHRGIVEYTPEKIRIGAGNKEIGILGEQMIIRSIFPDEICIDGKIESIVFI